MRVAVIGLGYVGTTTAACLATRGHQVLGVDTQPAKVACLAAGRTPVLEEGLDVLVADTVSTGRLVPGDDTAAAIADSDLSLVCVPSPSAPGGGVDTSFLERAAEEIGTGLAARGTGASRHTVVFRSTMPPGTCAGLLVPRLEKWSGLTAGVDFGVAVHPEFLREGSGIADFAAPSRSVVGGLDTASADAVAELCADLDAPLFRVPLEVAEMIKYADNAFHALKVGFANELGALARGLDVDADALVEVFLADHKLNLSAAYLRPGFAFGGSCLPKDLRALVYAADRVGIAVPILDQVLVSNDLVVQRAVDRVVALGARRVGVVGLAFKAGTDDLRESPMVTLCRRLIDRGCDVRVLDPAVRPTGLLGANQTFAEVHLPELPHLLVDSVDDVLAHADVLVAGSADAAAQAVRRARVPVVDLRGPSSSTPSSEEEDRVGLAG